MLAEGTIERPRARASAKRAGRRTPHLTAWRAGGMLRAECQPPWAATLPSQVATLAAGNALFAGPATRANTPRPRLDPGAHGAKAAAKVEEAYPEASTCLDTRDVCVHIYSDM